MEVRNAPHLLKRVTRMYERGDLKRLTITYAEGYVIAYDCLWCEIDFLSEKITASIFMEGEVPPLYTIDCRTAFKTDVSLYKEKTKVYECEIPKKEIMFFLDKVFYDYDLRLLGEKAFLSHPSCNYDFINGTTLIDDSAERLSIKLEATDGTTDNLRMDRYSIAGNILLSFINRCDTLSSIFVI